MTLSLMSLMLVFYLVVTGLIHFLNSRTLFTKRSPDETVGFYMQLDMQEMEELLDPITDLRMRFPYLNKKELKRLILATDHLKKICLSYDEQGLEEWISSLLLDSPNEMRSELGFYEDHRRDQRVRMETLRDRCRRMLHNARIERELAKTQLEDSRLFECDEEIIQTIQVMLKLRKASYECSWASRFALCRMWLWGLTGFEEREYFPVPSVAALRRVGKMDVLETYRRLKEMSIVAGRLCGGDELAQQVNDSM